MLLPQETSWAEGFEQNWQPGETGARDRLQDFLDNALARYGTDRDRPATAGTARLSAHLRFGEIGPRQVWHWPLNHVRSHGGSEDAAWSFLRELGWRDFNHNLLFHRPEMPERNLKQPFDSFPWRDDRNDFKAWSRGETGYPIVDAGMRELWDTGWMHNRVRMITASFLIKHLLLPWQWGEAWFWDTLLDADLANNTGNWQWVAGSGADAAPYFRIFNPVLQGEKFDSDGAYVRRLCAPLGSGAGRIAAGLCPQTLGSAVRSSGGGRRHFGGELFAAPRQSRQGPRAGTERLQRHQERGCIRQCGLR